MSDKKRAFCIDYPALASSLITDIIIIPKYPYNKEVAEEFLNNPQGVTFRAIWDTGATHSVITPRLIEKLNISNQISGYTQVCGVNSTISKQAVYKVGGIVLPNRVMLSEWELTESCLSPSEIDVLIGMDIICKGDFTISNYGNKTKFCFSIPSHDEVIDLVKKHS